MIDGSNGLLKMIAEKITDERHSGLKTSEIQTNDNCMLFIQALH